MVEEIDLEKCNFRNFRGPVTLTLTLNWDIGHTVVHQSSNSIYTPNFIEIVKTFCGQMDILMYLLTDISDPPLMLLGRLLRVDPKMGLPKTCRDAETDAGTALLAVDAVSASMLTNAGRCRCKHARTALQYLLL